MNPKSLVGSVAMLLLGTSMMATSYHIADTVGPDPVDNPATQWIGPGPRVVFCESEGLTDKTNPLPVKMRGKGGLCYASSFHDPDKGDPVTQADKKTKPKFSQTNLFDLALTQWSRVAPTCQDVDANANIGVENLPDGPVQPAVAAPFCPGGLVGPILGTFFIRVGNNAHSATGFFAAVEGSSVYYPEALAWWIGANGPNGGGNPNGLPASGHVTFFVDDPQTAGSYCFEQAVAALPAAAVRTPSSSGQVFIVSAADAPAYPAANCDTT